MAVTDDLLPVPTKATEAVDFEKELAEAISADFYQPPSVSAQLKQLTALRNSLLDPQPTLRCIATLKHYYMQITALRAKLPPDAVQFSWWPLFSEKTAGKGKAKVKPVSFRSLLWDQCNALFVIAALYSQLAATQNRYSAEGLKKAGIYFQYAAGCFKHLDDVLTPGLHEVTLDLSSDTLSALAYLCMASAQEIFWLKAVTDNLKDTVVAKLSMEVSQLYANAAHFEERSSTVFPKDWIDFCHVKVAHFKGASYYRMACHCGSQTHYGDQVAYLQKAASATSVVAKSGWRTKEKPQVMDDLENLQNVVKEDLRKAERENDLIYLQPVPDDVPDPSPASLVKPLIVSELKDPIKALREGDGGVFFADLIPSRVVDLAADFKARSIEYIKLNFDETLTAMNSSIDEFITSLHLDTELDSVLKPQEIPNSVLQYYRSLNEMGGMTSMDTQLSELSVLKLRARDELDECWQLLRTAVEEDDSLRAIYGQRRWQLRPIPEEASDIIQQLEQDEGYLKASENGDKTIYEQADQLRPYVHIYDSKETLRSFIPNSSMVDLNPTLKRQIVELKEKVRKLESLKEERQSFLQKVGLKFDSTDLLSQVVSKYKEIAKTSDTPFDESLYEPLLEEDRARFNDDIAWLPRTKADQEKQMAQIRKDDVTFKEAKRNLKVSPERSEALDVLSQTYHGYCETLGNIKQGLGFYNDFLASVGQTRKEIEGYLDERHTAAVSLEHSLDEADKRM